MYGYYARAHVQVIQVQFVRLSVCHAMACSYLLILSALLLTVLLVALAASTTATARRTCSELGVCR